MDNLIPPGGNNVSEELVPLFPNVATVEQIRDYLDWLVDSGRGQYRVEIRERYIALPPSKDACDDQAKVAFLRGII